MNVSDPRRNAVLTGALSNYTGNSKNLSYGDATMIILQKGVYTFEGVVMPSGGVLYNVQIFKQAEIVITAGDMIFLKHT